MRLINLSGGSDQLQLYFGFEWTFSCCFLMTCDGKQHFTDGDDRPSPSKYAATMAGDRDLRLAGYEVFRFGAAELDGDDGKALVKEFFNRLFRVHGVSPR